MLRSNSPACRTFMWLPVTKSTTGTSRGGPPRGQSVHTPCRPAVRETIGPAGSDMQMLPPMVAVFQILNDARNELQHWWNSAAAVHSGGGEKRYSSAIRHVAAIVSPSAEVSNAGQPSC